MNGLTIFTHSLRQVLGNLRMAVQISGWFVALAIGAFAIASLVFPPELISAFDGGQYVAPSDPAISGGLALLMIVAMFAALIIAAWAISVIAIAWHRYILLEEVPDGLVPYRSNFRVGRYFWYSVGISLLATLVVSIISGFLGMVFGFGLISAVADTASVGSTSMLGRAFLVSMVFGLVVTVLYLRMALILPAVALDDELTLAKAWEQSSGYMSSIFGLALALTFFHVVISMGMDAAHGGILPNWLFLIISSAYNWFYFMLNISILSTLYGHIMQKREVY